MANEFQVPHRVALYFAPPEHSAWWRAGSNWLGRCAITNQPLLQPLIKKVAPEHFAAITADPRHYGWHATLRAPFRLAPGHTLADVRIAMRQLCLGRQPVDLPTLALSLAGGFLALRPTDTPPALTALARDCVQQLQPLAAPLTATELERRRRAALTPEQDALLLAWGYPYVMDQFNFHLSLTGSLQGLSDAIQGSVVDAADRCFGDLPPCRIDRLSLFVEPTPGAQFRMIEQMDFEP
jgi:putative phosphonate metabolism protein